MLNEKGQRELAYVVVIDKIEPIEGSDNCEAAYVGGWHIMVRKGTFQAGDLAIYFEIDSHLDTTKPEFAFLEKKHGNIKTQRYTFGGKGNFISQGLLMHPSDFGWTLNEVLKVVGDAEMTKCIDTGKELYFANDESRFLTKTLNVSYVEESDNVRKSEYRPKSKYTVKTPTTKLGKWLMKRKWGRVLVNIFGKSKKKNGWPAWIKKTDEERCLVGNTKVLTDHGNIQISTIVNRKLDVNVASFNEATQKIEYKKIANYQKIINTDGLITIEVPYHVGCGRTRKICCTPDHKFLTPNGYVEAQHLSIGDEIFEHSLSYDEDALPIIYGMLLGDSHIQIDKRNSGLCRIVHTNGDTQKEYLAYKQSLFEGSSLSGGFFGNWKNSKPVYHCVVPVDAMIDKFIRDEWIVDGKKTITHKCVNRLTDASLAFWYMDDGTISYKESGKPHIRLNTQGFSHDENIILSECLHSRFGIENTIQSNEKNGKTYYLIYIRRESVDKFLALVSPYLCPSMSYKTTDDYRNVVGTKVFSFSKHETILQSPIISIRNGQCKNSLVCSNPKYVYDIEVEDNHNFIADNILVHNCQNLPERYYDNKEWIATEKIDGSSTTFALKKKQFYVCSRNVCFDTSNAKCYYDVNIYTEMAQKYDMRNKLKKMLDGARLVNKNTVGVIVQAETYGAGVQRRDYGLKGHDMAIFNIIWVYKDGSQRRLNPTQGKNCAAVYDLPYVPVIGQMKLGTSCEEVLEYAGRYPSKIDGGMREGLVFRSLDGVQSFKAVNNEYLLKYHG